MDHSILNEIESPQLLKNGDAVVVGVSGGPDSMAMLHLLVDLDRRSTMDLKITVAHLNHSLRGEESDEDEAFVKNAAAALGTAYRTCRRDIPVIAARESLGIEETARRERYAFFERVCLQTGAKFVAVGHHADDQTETILHRILRGTGFRGLSGMPGSRPLRPDSDIHLIRPLLGITRNRILQYLSEAGIPFRRDRTNDSDEPMRNRIRNKLLPLIVSEINPQVGDAIRRLGVQADWINEHLGDTVRRTFDSIMISQDRDRLVLRADALTSKSRILQSELLRTAVVSLGFGERRLTFEHQFALLRIVAGETDSVREQLPFGITVERRGHELVFSRPTPTGEISANTVPVFEIEVACPGRTVIPALAREIICRTVRDRPVGFAAPDASGRRFEEFVDADRIQFPLRVRSCRSGDRFHPLGSPGSKSVGDFLTDAKASETARREAFLLCDGHGPVWLVGRRIDDRVKLTDQTVNLLQLMVRPISW